jgi:hypothetical protein
MLNIRDTFGKQYRVALDPSAASWADPAYHVLRTKTGEVHVHGEEHAGVEVRSKHFSIIRDLAGRGFRLHQDGDELKTFLVPWEELADVLPMLRPYRRRQLSAEQRQRLAAASAPHRFTRRDGAGAAPEGHAASPGDEDDPRVA